MDILRLIRTLQAAYLDDREIVAAVVRELESENQARDRWADRQSEAAERAEYERAHGQAVSF